ncbi:Probable lipid phosphate phosphatase beta [Linum perenne]
MAIKRRRLSPHIPSQRQQLPRRSQRQSDSLSPITNHGGSATAPPPRHRPRRRHLPLPPQALPPFHPDGDLHLLEITADFQFSFPVSLALLLSPLSPQLLPLFSPLLLDLAVVGLTKSIFRRARPSYNHSSMSAVVAMDHYSFPSGHSTRVFFVTARKSSCEQRSLIRLFIP